MRNQGAKLSVYIISPDPAGPCKIGYAGCPERRLADLQIGNHLELKLWSKWASDTIGNREIERRMHAILNDRHIRGEWFDVSVAEAESILALLDDKQAFDKSKDNAALLLRAMAYHPRWNA